MNEREQLLDALKKGREQLDETVKAIPRDAWNRGVYENGWNAKQLLCHLAGGTPTGFILDMASRPENGPAQDFSGFDIDAWNKQEVESKESKSIDELLAEARAGFETDATLVGDASDELLSQHYKAPWGLEGSVASVIIEAVSGHLGAHLAELRAATS